MPTIMARPVAYHAPPTGLAPQQNDRVPDGLHVGQVDVPLAKNAPGLSASASASAIVSNNSISNLGEGHYTANNTRDHLHGSLSAPASAGALATPSSPQASVSPRFARAAAPHPLNTSAAKYIPPTADQPPSIFVASPTTSPHPSTAVPRIVTSSPSAGRAYYDGDSSDAATPKDKSPRSLTFPSSPGLNEVRNYSNPFVTTPTTPISPAFSSRGHSSIYGIMASSSSTTSRPGDAAQLGPIRTMSVDSHDSKAVATSAIPDVASLIKTAGSPEAVIQYLLKEKHSQSQQNSQLWRLVDKQRAMILGLNQDLERALKDKEKYRKKLKEILADARPGPTISTTYINSSSGAPPRKYSDVTLPSPRSEIPISPGLDSDCHRDSPISVSLAPYPITPPADHTPDKGSSFAVGDMLDPSRSMPNASEFTLDNFDADAQDREADRARKRADAANDIPLILDMPLSRNWRRLPPSAPPPNAPAPAPILTSSGSFSASPAGDAPESSVLSFNDGIAQFPPPPNLPPPRKPPPPPLQLDKGQPSPTLPPDDLESESDLDKILEQPEFVDDEKRGRRRTRAEDDVERELLARKEAEARSLSKKQLSSNRQPGSAAGEAGMPTSPRGSAFTPLSSPPRALNAPPLSRLSGGSANPAAKSPGQPMPSPGLPVSPHPGSNSTNNPSPAVSSPPLSPLGPPKIPIAQGLPSSPRASRPPVPFTTNGSSQTPSQPSSPLPYDEPIVLTSPKPLQTVKRTGLETNSAPSPTKRTHDSPVGRTHIYKGLVTDAYPDLLLPPNALLTIDIKVASCRMKPSRSSMLSLTQLEEDRVFTLAVLHRKDGSELWRVEKDAGSLAGLNQRLKQCPAFTARVPDRALFSGHAPAKVDARRFALNKYYEDILSTPFDTAIALDLCRWLSVNVLPPNADETGAAPADAASDALPKSGLDGRPFRTGYLTKRGKNFGGWKARFFVLDGAHLKYYESPGGQHLGTIKLQSAQIGKQLAAEAAPGHAPAADEDENQYRHAFLILEPKKKDPKNKIKHVLCAESDRERDCWVDDLLRWVDYGSPDEERPRKKGESDASHARQGSLGSDQPHHKKKLHSQGRQDRNQSSLDTDDVVIGVNYDHTKRGDLPERDASNLDAWGTKLSPTTQEEKKTRKRSFFGFGPKTRGSGDGQDSIFSGIYDNSSSSTVQTSSISPYGGQSRQVFGMPLSEAVRHHPPRGVDIAVPAVVYRCIEYLDSEKATSEEGIFRLSGSSVVIKELRERFNNEGDVDLILERSGPEQKYHDIHAVAGVLKTYLRDLPSILTPKLSEPFVKAIDITDPQEKIAKVAEIVKQLPDANSTLLRYMLSFLIRIIDNASVNKMTLRNVGIVFSPTLNIPAPIFALFLQQFKAIFGIDPQLYHLPIGGREDSSSIASQDQAERQAQKQQRRPAFPKEPPRPYPQHERGLSDSHPAASSLSPGRQPTRPGGKDMHGPQNTPTQPPMIGMTYDQPQAQQLVGGGGGGLIPPAYELYRSNGQSTSWSRLREENHY